MNSLIRLATINSMPKKSCSHSRLQWPDDGVFPPSKKATPAREALISLSARNFAPFGGGSQHAAFLCAAI